MVEIFCKDNLLLNLSNISKFAASPSQACLALLIVRNVIAFILVGGYDNEVMPELTNKLKYDIDD